MIKNSISIEERRKKPRFKISANCSFHSFDPRLFQEESNIYRIEDIGLGGLSFLSDKAIDLNKRLYFIIAIQKTFIEEPIDAIGDVIWISPSKFGPDQYRIGVKFVKMLDDDLINLTHQFHVSHHSNDDIIFKENMH